MECALQSLSTDLVSRYGPGASIVYKHGPYAQALNEVRQGRVERPAAAAAAATVAVAGVPSC